MPGAEAAAVADPAAAAVRAGGEALAELMVRVEARMSELASQNGPLLARYAGQTISAGGKRLRPVLVCLAAGVPPPLDVEVVRSAVAVELVHSATLVHDDVLDRAGLRRGRPTVFALAGPRMATAAGDLLFSRAFAELAAEAAADSPDGPVAEGIGPDAAGMLDRARTRVRMLARASRELAEGELMQRADAYVVDVSRERYLQRCRLKTGVLFRAACELGAVAGGGRVPDLARYGELVGVAFQILDDVLDITGPPERTGKPRGADLLDGTVTLPFVLARGREPHLAAADLRQVRTPEQAAEFCDLIASTGALTDARGLALEHVAEAKGLLRGLPDRQRAALELVADGVVERYS